MFDKNTQSNLVTVADIDSEGRVRTNSTFLITGKLIGTVDLNSAGESFHIIVPDGALTIRGPALGQVIEDN